MNAGHPYLIRMQIHLGKDRIEPQMKGIAPDDFASLEKLLPGEWKKTHPESHSMVHHTTEAEHVAAILKSRAKRKDSEEEVSKGESK